nr:MAG TPA: hypothetical protein [Caudoviricetes sp.]
MLAALHRQRRKAANKKDREHKQKFPSSVFSVFVYAPILS